MIQRRFARSVATVSGLTGLSRILGFVRDVLMAAILGDGRVADAWHAAFTLPNIFRRTFAEGAMQSAFVPLLRGKLEDEGEAVAELFAKRAFTALLLILLPLSALLILAMPLLIDGMTRIEPGTDRFDLAILFGRIMFPYLILMTGMAYIGSILNTLDRFGPLALAPTMLNVVLIVLLVWLRDSQWLPGHVLSWGVLVAGFAQVLVVWIPAWALGWTPALALPRGTGRFLARMLNGTIAAGGMQISAIIVLYLATTIEGDYTRLQYANRLYQLPIGLIGIALNTVLIATLSRLIEQGEAAGALVQLNRALELSLLVSIPVALACAFHANFLFTGLFQWGNFGAEASAGAALALVGYAIGIPAAVGQKVLQPAFFARQDTRTPMYHSLFALALAVCGSYLLYPAFGIFGLTLAASLSSWMGFLSLAVHIRQLGYFTPDQQLLRRFILMILAGGLMVCSLELALRPLGQLAEWSLWVRLPLTFASIFLASLVYFAFSLVLKATSMADLRNLIGRA